MFSGRFVFVFVFIICLFILLSLSLLVCLLVTRKYRSITHFDAFFLSTKCISQLQQCPPPRAFAAFLIPGVGAIAEIFQPRGGKLDVFHHGDWRTITWQDFES